MGYGSLPKTHKEEETTCSYLKPGERDLGERPGWFVCMGFEKLVYTSSGRVVARAISDIWA